MGKKAGFFGGAIFAVLVLSLLGSGCGSRTAGTSASAESAALPAESGPEPVEFYFYLNGDSDILGARPDGEIDHQAEIVYDELRALLPAANFGVHAYLDRGISLRGGDPIDSETYDRCADAPAEIRALGETDSADPRYLRELLAKRCYPAAKRFVALWSHGDGYRVQNDYDFDPSDRGFHVSTLLREIPDGFAEAVLFDSCAMASLEVASLLEGKAKWMLASQFELPNVGIRYGGLPALLGKSRETGAILSLLRADSERAFAETGATAPLVLLDLAKLPAVSEAFARAWAAATAKVAAAGGDAYAEFRSSVLRGARDGDLYFLFSRYAPDAMPALTAALESGRGSLHFALPATTSDRDADLEAVAASAPEVFRTWSEKFPNWAAYARVRSVLPASEVPQADVPKQGVQ
ncbi:MAG: hypothetical protein JST04_06085 [Bdellovibrionales bacterium]|nr:hypothetical protein [Bdellovibrionales bacterium]